VFTKYRIFSTSALLTLTRLAGAGIGFLTQVALARLLSAEELGLFYSVTSLAPIVSLVVALGYPNIMTRFISRYRERGKPGYEAAFIRRARRDTFIWAILSATVISIAALLIPGFSLDLRWAIVLTALTVIPYSSERVLGTIAVAYRRFALAHLPGMALRPMFFAMAIAVAWLAGIPMSVLELVFLTLVAVSLAWGVQYILLRTTLAKLEKPAATPRLVKRWRREAWPLVMVAAFTGLLSELAVLLATPFMQSADVAAFGICLKLAFLVGFAVQAAHQTILPDLGDAAARRERGGMSAKLLAASLFPIVVTGLAVIASVAAGELLLGVFGEEFKAAKTTLIILLVAQLVRALAGPSPHLLTLRGAQTISAAICGASLAVLLIGNALLAPMLGSEGAAISLLVTTVFWLGATAIALHRVGGARSDLAGLLQRRRALDESVASEAAE